MKKSITLYILIGLVFQSMLLTAQETSDDQDKLKLLEQKRESILIEEKYALKREVVSINEQLEKNEISIEEADKKKAGSSK